AMFGLNMLLAASSSIILQQTALKARERGLEQLKSKVNQKQRQAAASVAEHESDQAEMLPADIVGLRRGAFVPISRNPLVGALLVNSSGLIVIEVLALILSK